MNDETVNVSMTASEREAFEAFRREQERKEKAAERAKMRREYSRMVDVEVAEAIPELQELSAELGALKRTVYDNFRAVLEMKTDVMGLTRDGQFTHTFTHSDGTMRITLGNRTIDSYRDTVEEGIQMVKSYIVSLAKDDESSALVEAVMRLLSRDKRGQIKASRVLELRQLADKSGNEQFVEGVRIIEEAYNPTRTKTFVKAEVKTEDGWQTIPLNITEV